jgi:hypothetical protein
MIMDNAAQDCSNQTMHRSFSSTLYVHLNKYQLTVQNRCAKMLKGWTIEDATTANVLFGLGFNRRQIRMGVELQKALQKPVTCAAIATTIKKTPQHCSPNVRDNDNTVHTLPFKFNSYR